MLGFCSKHTLRASLSGTKKDVVNQWLEIAASTATISVHDIDLPKPSANGQFVVGAVKA